MNTVKNLTTIHFRLNQKDTLNDFSNKVFVPNKIEDLSLSLFNMIPGVNESKTYHANVSVNLMEENVTQINSGITVHVNVSVRNMMYVKKFIF